MFALDLFNTDHERRIAEGAVDQLEQRRIDDLAMKMDDLVARAKTPAYKKNPAALAALMKEFQKCKAERDSYYKIRNETMGYGGLTAEAGIPGNVPVEKIPGKEDLLKGKGRSYYEGQKKNSEAGPLDQKLQRLKVQARRQFPRAHTDDEALILKMLDKETQDDQANRRTDARQDAELRKNFALDREQDDDIDNLQTQVSVKEHGGGIGPKQHWQDLMQERKLSAGDPVIVTAPNEFEGKTGEIYELSPSGTFVIVDLYNHGRHGMHLSNVEYNQYADDQKQDDWYDEGVAEGWSDAMVARRTGSPRTPYSVYIKGKKWKDFENENHAQAVADKLRAKFKAEGRDPGVITIAPTDMSEAISKKDLVGQLQQDLPKVTDPKNKDANPVNWTGPGKDDYGYTGYQGHGMPTDKQERELAKKNKGVGEAIVASGPSKPLDDRAVRKMVWDTMKINADTGEQALQRALAVLAKKPQSRMVQDLQDKFQNLSDRLAQGIAEGAISNLHAELSDVYNRMAPGIERNRDSFKAGQLYDALEAVAEQHGAEAEFKRMMNGARNRAHMEYDTNPGGFHNWFWFLPFADEELSEEQDTSGVERAILNRIMVAHTDLLMKFGPEKVMQAAEEVAYNVGDVDEIGTSDVSAYVHQVKQILGVPEELDEKWSQKYKSSINCANPKGFSQKAHCAGRKK